MGNHEYLIWIDLEMTGLMPEHRQIIEIATVVTDTRSQRDRRGSGARDPPAEERAGAHGRVESAPARRLSGLLARVRASRMTAAEAERQTLLFLARHVPAGASPMCGNSICQDRRFLARWMPELERFFHYRNLDVSTLKELARRWYPQLAAVVQQALGASGARRYLRVDRRTALLSRTPVRQAGVTQVAVTAPGAGRPDSHAIFGIMIAESRPGGFLARAPARLRRADGPVREQLPAPGCTGGRSGARWPTAAFREVGRRLHTGAERPRAVPATRPNCS